MATNKKYASHCKELRGMDMHVHIGLLHVLTVFASVIVVGFFWRLAASRYSDTAIGQAMAFVY